MNSKLANISKWAFGALALITVALGIYFYMDLENDSHTNIILNWGYILIILSFISILCSVNVSIVLKGLNMTMSALITVIVAVVLAAVALIFSHGWVERGLNFFYLFLFASFVAIIYSLIKSAIK